MKGNVSLSKYAIALVLENGKPYYVANVYEQIDLFEWPSKAIEFHTEDSAKDFLSSISRMHPSEKYLVNKLQVIELKTEVDKD